ncbi:MAG: single-stranded DNA-binding protein [Cryomorphaceae bacterium]|nr:single-stranded DNA-binding protein [Cryomorphaceae bacterium]
MNALKNKVQLIGNLGAKPEIITFDSGKKLAKASLATTEQFKNANGEKVEKTSWHRLNVWGKLADVMEKYTEKGSEILVEGRINYSQYKTKEGEERHSTEIEVQELMLLRSPKNGKG